MLYDAVPGLKSGAAIRMLFCEIMQAFPGNHVHDVIVSQTAILSRINWSELALGKLGNMGRIGE